MFLLIAGTYTPVTLVLLRANHGWTLLGLVWGLSAFGIVLKLTCTSRHRWVLAGTTFHFVALWQYVV